MQGVAADVMVIPCSFSCSIQSIFLFQAGDGIRDGHVTGVQTCALPIYKGELLREISQLKTAIQLKEAEAIMTLGGEQAEIGRASRTERVNRKIDAAGRNDNNYSMIIPYAVRSRRRNSNNSNRRLHHPVQ